MAQSVVYIYDANGVKQPIGCITQTWGGVSAQLQASLAVPWNYTAVTATGITIIKGTPGILGAVISLDPNNPQTPIITIYDNVSSGSGNQLDAIANLVGTKGYGSGINALNGIVVDLSSQPNTSAGINILWI